MSRLFRVTVRILKNPAYLKQYWNRYVVSRFKLYFAYIILLFCGKRLYQQNIWLVREKGTEARDNGYHFYRYIRERHPEINAFYIISKDAPDRDRVNAYGNILNLNSIQHYVYYLAAKVSVNSQPGGAAPDPSEMLRDISKKIVRKDQIVVFLQHGVTKDELPRQFDYERTGYDLFCCATGREQEFIAKVHGYPDNRAMTLGFCRFDSLIKEHAAKKQILIMPTYRMWLCAANTYMEASAKEKKEFVKSEYYQIYISLLSDARFIHAVRDFGYRIVFYPHFAEQSFISCFEEQNNDIITIADRNHYDVQKLLLESAVLVTDYSSVSFDFAYLGKPLLYYQFDEDRYRKEHYKKGYFDYHKDGFGPVCKEQNDVIDEIITILRNGCGIEQKYADRIDSFFTFRDTNNCSRTFKAIEEIAKQKN